MNSVDFLQNVVYPALATLITAGVSLAVVYIRAMAANQKQATDATQLQQVLDRGAALAKTETDDPAAQARSVTKYLHATSPDLAVRTGMAVTANNGNVLAQTAAADMRIDATVAVANDPPIPDKVVTVKGAP